MSMTKDEKLTFLERGGILMRSGTNAKGEHCIQWRTLFRKYGDFYTLTCQNAEHAEKQMKLLAFRHPDKFQIDQDN